MYQPVCAVRGDRQRTFGNGCEANAQGWRVVAQGECGGNNAGRPDPGGPGGDTDDGGTNGVDFGPGDTEPAQPGGPDLGTPTKACTREYAPVCATKGGATRTFGNQCSAEAVGWNVIRRGEC
ncbi:MAG: protease inhibitor [Rhizobiaceae bacterium]|nr:protease inhibitor [Rhizobiaceae bacterium]